MFVLSSGIENFQSISIKRNNIFFVFFLYFVKFEFFKDLIKIIFSKQLFINFFRKDCVYCDYNYCVLLVFYLL